MIDTHAHLDGLEDLDAALARAHEAGVTAVVTMGEGRTSNEANLALRQRFSSPKIYVGLGIHPGSIPGIERDDEIAFIEGHLDEAHAIGEIGLDFWYQWARHDEAKKEEQRRVYRRMLEIARDHDLPASIHTRGAWTEAVAIAREVGVRRAVFHWYSGPLDVLERILEAGYYVSAAPSVSYSPEARAALSVAPIEQTLLETDTPVFYRDAKGGFRAEPKDVFRTLRDYTALHKRDEGEVARIVTENAKRFFGI